MATFKLSQENAAFFYKEIEEIVFDELAPQTTQILVLRGVLSELLHTITAEEPQLFTDLYSRLLFVSDKYSFPGYISRELHAFRRIATRAGRKNIKIPNEAVRSSARALALVVFFFSEERAPEPLRTLLLEAKPFTKEPASTKSHLPLVRITVQGFGLVESKHGRAFVELQGLTHDGEMLLVRIWEPWHDVEQLAWEFCTLHVTALRFVEIKTVELTQQKAGKAGKIRQEDEITSQNFSLYETTADSMVILEPDYLLDVTDLAECVQRQLPSGGNPRISLLKKFLPTEVKMSLVSGSIANYCFDALLTNPDVEFDTIFREAILQKPLQIVALQHENKEAVNLLRMHSTTVFDNIRALLTTLQWDKASIEASFISPLYGLQGRLDLMVEYDDDPNRKTIVELKSGSAPANATWENHAAQVTAYNLLLDSCFRERSGDSCIFYARDSVRPLRNIPNDRHSKQLLLALRNRIIAQEHSLSLRQPRTLQDIHPEHFGLMPTFIAQEVQRFAQTFALASSLERKYFRVFSAFVNRENWAARTGSERGEGFSGLWRKSLNEKADEYSILAHLELDVEESDFTKLHLHFHRTEQTSALANFRVGDIILLYPLLPEDADERSFLRGAMLKGYIKRISRNSVVVSLRNKQMLSANSKRTLFRSEVLWAIEPDFFGTEFKSQYESLYDFLKAPERKRNLLLGLEKPMHNEEIRQRVQNTPMGDLTEEQHARLADAMSAEDYFLLQGPPGTGKTSRMLKSMAVYLHGKTNENILFLAFTNRAVDEICDALKSAELEFIRLGSKESTSHTNRVLYTLTEGKTIAETEELFSGTRILVSTISSLLKNLEVLAIKNFDTVIIDEASQVVEPQLIGLLARFKRFMLIGDEKQLPAVVVQPERGVAVRDEELNAAGFFDLRTSMFERLITRCKQNAWTESYGIISKQGRMHADIAAFPNIAFYDSVLTPLTERQTRAIAPSVFENLFPNISSKERSEIVRVQNTLSKNRVVFWQSEEEQQTKVHEGEAARAALLAKTFHAALGAEFHTGSIGIITPFRAQIAAIYHALPQELHESITVDTVERYQGSERDIIILSFAVNFPSQVRSVQSLSTDGAIDRKLNVALTRARERMIVLGRAEVLSHSPILRRFIGFVEERGGFVGSGKNRSETL
ncbi:MAG: AAA domain-containing protein [Candidatus Kapabacteria bacterium]|jgi:DNA replication ATP-dependent helicase Dna2|nr:AAA domain-containing protein [Candidatus Kapabacteria bacterium]